MRRSFEKIRIKFVRKFIGYDANALYSWALTQDMPTGPFTIRKEENEFQLTKRDRYLKALYFLEWLRHSRGLDIDHYFNAGKEFRIGSYRVDGFCKAEKKVYEFNGCYFRAHDCNLTANITDPKWLNSRKKIRKREQERIEYIKSQGYEVEVTWECQYEEWLNVSPEFRLFIEKQRQQRLLEHRATLTRDEILSAVREQKIFGAVEVDIHVPNHLLN